MVDKQEQVDFDLMDDSKPDSRVQEEPRLFDVPEEQEMESESMRCPESETNQDLVQDREQTVGDLESEQQAEALLLSESQQGEVLDQACTETNTEDDTALEEILAQRVVSEEKLQQELEEVRNLNQELQQRIGDLESERQEKEHSLSRGREENEALIRELTEVKYEVTKLRKDLAQRAVSEEELQQVLADAQQLNQALEEQLTVLRNEQEQKQQMLEGVEKDKEHLQQDLDALKRKKDALESDKMVITQERDKAEAMIGEIKAQYQWELVKSVSPLLTKLSALANLEPEAVRGLTPRSVFEKMKNWIEEITGERVSAFPDSKAISAGLFLDPDKEGWDHLMECYDWSPEHPFEGAPEGERRRQFRVLQRGWRTNGKVLVRSRVMPVEQAEGTSE